MRVVIIEDKGSKWVCCGHCGHKLAKIIGNIPKDEQFEIKCSSCKQLNIIQVANEKEENKR